MSLPAVIDRAEVEHRLRSIFPRAAFDTSLSSPIAAAGVTSMIYAGAIVPTSDDLPSDARWMSPTMCLWMSDETLGHATDGERDDWYRAAKRGQRKVASLLESWGQLHAPWYANNSREPLRDESFNEMKQRGAVRFRPGLPQNYSGPRWALDETFAALFHPGLLGDDLLAAIDQWREDHMGPLELIKIATHVRLGTAVDAVLVVIPPHNDVRQLEPGTASQILRGVIEEWAPARLAAPVVLSISEPGNKLYLADQATMAAAGISVNVSKLLPDALLVDIGSKPIEFWIVEAVASDGEIDEARKTALLQWASDMKIPVERCRFMTAFTSRGSAPAKKRLRDLASGTYAWFLDEPGRELAWYEIGP